MELLTQRMYTFVILPHTVLLYCFISLKAGCYHDCFPTSSVSTFLEVVLSDLIQGEMRDSSLLFVQREMCVIKRT